MSQAGSLASLVAKLYMGGTEINGLFGNLFFPLFFLKIYFFIFYF